MIVGLVPIEGCFASGVAALLDVLRTADAVRTEIDSSIPPIQVHTLGWRKKVSTGAGLSVPVDGGMEELAVVDLCVVPALGTLSGPATIAALDSRDGRRLVASLSRAAPVSMAAACTGTFALAEAGLLDHERATTSWWLGRTFRQRYPSVDLDLNAMIVVGEHAMTAGAAFAHLDLALAIVGRISPDLAHHVARLLLIDERASQNGYLAVGHLDHDDALVRDFERRIRSTLDRPASISTIAREIGASRRTLERRVRLATEMSPTEFVQRVRVERARHLVRGGLSVEQAAPQVGYANAATLRSLIRRHR